MPNPTSPLPTTSTLNPYIGWIIAAICSTMAVFLLTKYVNWKKEKSDKNKVYNWLLENTSHSDWVMRSAKTISSHVNLTEERVKEVCSKHDKIRQARGNNAKDMWGLKSMLDRENK